MDDDSSLEHQSLPKGTGFYTKFSQVLYIPLTFHTENNGVIWGPSMTDMCGNIVGTAHLTCDPILKCTITLVIGVELDSQGTNHEVRSQVCKLLVRSFSLSRLSMYTW